jgi:hypothetical protein
MKNRKAAMELSMSTIVILVLAMSMLILGLVLVKAIFTGAKYNVDQMNDKVKGEIGKLFSEDRKVVMYLPNQKAEIKQGSDWGVGFGIKNFEKSQEFVWEVKLMDDTTALKANCGLSSRAETTVESWLKGGKTGEAEIPTGDDFYTTLRVNVPKGEISDITNCLVRFHLIVKKKETKVVYATESFDIQVK